MRKHGNTIFQFDEQSLVENEAVCAFANTPDFHAIAAEYLGTPPLIDLITMWWSFATQSGLEEQSGAAQLYHFDLDRLSFVKVFVYLTDVDENTGPHSYIKGSHKGYRGATFTRDGRFSDEEVAAAYPKEEYRICGPAGTVFIADTKGLHKGNPLIDGERLMFQIQFVNSLFGAPSANSKIKNPALISDKNKAAFAKYFL